MRADKKQALQKRQIARALSLNYWRDIFVNIIKWEGIEDFPLVESADIENILFNEGKAVVCLYDGDIVFGSLIETYVPNIYKKPLQWSCRLGNGKTINKLNETNSVIIYNSYSGEPPIRQLAERLDKVITVNDTIDLSLAWYNLRHIFTTNDPKNIFSLKKVMEDAGLAMAQYVDKELFEGLSIENLNTTLEVDKLTDLYNFRKNEILEYFGIDFVAVDKKERVNTIEASSNKNLINGNKGSMLSFRKDAVKKINALFGTNVSVDFNALIFESLEEVQTVEVENE